MGKKITAFCIAILLAAISFSQSIKHGKFSNPSGRYTYNYAIYDPSDGTQTLPVLFFIPGNGEVGSDVTKLYRNGSPLEQIKSGRLKPTNYIVVAWQPVAVWPNHYHVGWAIDYMLKNYKIDTNNVFLTGLSGGAGGIFSYIRNSPESFVKKIKGIIPMSISISALCGNFYSNTDSLCGTDLRYKDISVFGLSGSTDSHTGKMKRYVELMMKSGFDAKWHTYSGGHCCWSTVYNPSFKVNGESIYEWMEARFSPVNEPDDGVILSCSQDGKTIEVLKDGTWRYKN